MAGLIWMAWVTWVTWVTSQLEIWCVGEVGVATITLGWTWNMDCDWHPGRRYLFGWKITEVNHWR